MYEVMYTSCDNIERKGIGNFTHKICSMNVGRKAAAPDVNSEAFRRPSEGKRQ
jgi:hypothetical protein